MTDAALDKLWIRLGGNTPETRARLLKDHGIDIDTVHDMQSDDKFLYLPLRPMVRKGEGIAHRAPLLLMVGDDAVITLQEEDDFPPFSAVFRHLRRHPEAQRSPLALACLLLHAINEEASKVIAAIGGAVEEASDTISEITRSLNAGLGTLGVTDINDTILDLNKMEALVARALESQLSLARAARYLDAEVDPGEDLEAHIRTLREDINGVKEHALFEHDSVRYLQNAVLSSLNIKQNQIVKVFTIITAVFLPPTLVASIYGMNFAVMPELAWIHGFPAAIGLATLAALLPMLYIKYRGWLR